MEPNYKNDLVLIIGGGPAGFAAALAFDNNNYKNIIVLEGRTDMNFDVENSYPVALNFRGQNAIKNLFAKPDRPTELSNIGLRVDQWKVIVGSNINVANIDSGLSYGTSRAAVTNLLYDEVKTRNSIKILFGHKANDIDLKSKTVKCITNTGEKREFNPICLIIADGYKSKVRDIIAKNDSSLKIQQWTWNNTFRSLTSQIEPKTDLNPYIHYIQNDIYIAKFLNGKWAVVLSIKDKSPPVLSSNDPSDANIDELEKYIKKMAPISASLFTRDDYRRYFSRTIFSGAVTKVSKIVIDEWAVLIGDAAHSVYPATGEGINSALEDGFVLQKSLNSQKELPECLIDFEKNRLEDANALSDIAYSTINETFKENVQMIALGLLKKFVGPSKEDLLFGKNSSKIQRYSDIVKHWKKQTWWLGGPNIPN